MPVVAITSCAEEVVEEEEEEEEEQLIPVCIVRPP